jgi:Type IX secretion system protein PorV
MKKMNNILRLIALLILISNTTKAQVKGGCSQGYNVITGQPCSGPIRTAVPFLLINPDARSGAMGDAGIANGADANSIHFNASKLAFAEQNFGASLTYTPWLRNLGVNDIYLAYATGFYKFGNKAKQAVGVGLRYFSLGSLEWTDYNGNSLGQGTPREVEVAVSYSRQLSENLAVGATGKYIYSNLATDQSVGTDPIQSGVSGAFDFSLTYRKPFKMAAGKSNLTIGASIKNVGNKITYLRTADFLPTNLGLGGAWEMPFDQYNSIIFALDFNKLLVPSPDSAGLWRNKSVISGVFSSFGDAAGGFSEEVTEINTSFGIEYWYDKQFAVRAGYFYEPVGKGGRQYFTVGLGLKYSILGINLSYLVPTSSSRGPLDNTLRFSLMFDAASFRDTDTESN